MVSVNSNQRFTKSESYLSVVSPKTSRMDFVVVHIMPIVIINTFRLDSPLGIHHSPFPKENSVDRKDNTAKKSFPTFRVS